VLYSTKPVCSVPGPGSFPSCAWGVNRGRGPGHDRGDGCGRRRGRDRDGAGAIASIRAVPVVCGARTPCAGSGVRVPIVSSTATRRDRRSVRIHAHDPDNRP
jgi:hypothetical protein